MERYRIHADAAVYYLTYSVVEWLPVFVSEAACRIVADSLTLRDQATADRDRRFWQPSRHPVALQGERFWRQRFDYLRDNPGRKGLVRNPEHWRYSSALWYHTDGAQAVDVPVTWIVW